MAKWLISAKDNGAANVTKPVALFARAQGHEVVPAIEGLAMAKYEADGFSNIVKNATVNFETEPFDFDADALIEEVCPDVLVAGISSPIHIEKLLLEAAWKYRQKYSNKYIRIVAIEDFWGAVWRFGDYTPDLVLTLDDYGVELARGTFPYAKAIAVGNIGVSNAQTIAVDPEIERQFQELRQKYEKVFLFVGGGPVETDAELKLLVASLKRTKGSWCLISRLHPKYMKAMSETHNKPWAEVYDDVLAPVADRIVRLEAKSTEPLALLSDATFSGFSTVAATALWGGKPTVSLWPEATRQSLLRQARLDAFPLVKLGCAISLTEPEDLNNVLERAPSDVEVKKKLKPFDAIKAYTEILKLL